MQGRMTSRIKRKCHGTYGMYRVSTLTSSRKNEIIKYRWQHLCTPSSLFAADEGECGIKNHSVSNWEILIPFLFLNLRKLRSIKKDENKKRGIILSWMKCCEMTGHQTVVHSYSLPCWNNSNHNLCNHNWHSKVVQELYIISWMKVTWLTSAKGFIFCSYSSPYLPSTSLLLSLSLFELPLSLLSSYSPPTLLLPPLPVPLDDLIHIQRSVKKSIHEITSCKW